MSLELLCLHGKQEGPEKMLEYSHVEMAND